MIVCSRCKTKKPFDSFRKNKYAKTGHQSACKECMKIEYQENKDSIIAQQKEYYARTRDAQIEKRRQYYKNNKEKCLQSIKKYNEKNPHVKRNSYFKRNYGITLGDYEALLEKQESKCAVCGDSPEYNLVVDHNHDTGEIRGLLCQPCNQALGLLKDSPEIIQSAQNYLKERGYYGPEVTGSP